MVWKRHSITMVTLKMYIWHLAGSQAGNLASHVENASKKTEFQQLRQAVVPLWADIEYSTLLRNGLEEAYYYNGDLKMYVWHLAGSQAGNLLGLWCEECRQKSSPILATEAGCGSSLSRHWTFYPAQEWSERGIKSPWWPWKCIFDTWLFHKLAI